MMTPVEKSENQISEELIQLIRILAASGKSVLPGSPDALLNSIVEAAAKIFGAAAASIMLVNEAEGVLEFKVACGASNRDLVGTRMPINQGIAGYVVMSGQPIAISDVEQDARFNRDFAKSTGYVPHSILATPLIVGERVLGVMEVLDKINAPSFGMQDMELLGLFANQAAMAIEQAQGIQNINDALLLGLKRLATSDTEHPLPSILAALENPPEASGLGDLLSLADQLNEFSQMGEAERETVLKILAAFSAYSQNIRRVNTGAGLR